MLLIGFPKIFVSKTIVASREVEQSSTGVVGGVAIPLSVLTATARGRKVEPFEYSHPFVLLGPYLMPSECEAAERILKLLVKSHKQGAVAEEEDIFRWMLMIEKESLVLR
jgi:hypothetical protein